MVKRREVFLLQIGATAVDLFPHLSTLAKACGTDKRDVAAVVAGFISIPFYTRTFGDQFDYKNEGQLNEAKEILSNVCYPFFLQLRYLHFHAGPLQCKLYLAN